MIIVGERLNSSRKPVRDALASRDSNFLIDQALRQQEAGAGYIDLNAAALVDQELEVLSWAVPLLERALSVPLSIDTPNAAAMEKALRISRRTPLLNSLTAETARTKALLPLIREFKPRIIVLCLDDAGVPKTPDRAAGIACRMVDRLDREGLSAENLFFDPLIRPVGVEPEAVVLFLESIARIKESLPAVKTIAGISNVSFGLPKRKVINRTVLTLALQRGLDAAICDPFDRDLRLEAAAAEALLGRDPGLRNYLRIFRELSKADVDPSKLNPES
jgi:cobalamin-dependent methionine synthase I